MDLYHRPVAPPRSSINFRSRVALIRSSLLLVARVVRILPQYQNFFYSALTAVSVMADTEQPYPYLDVHRSCVTRVHPLPRRLGCSPASCWSPVRGVVSRSISFFFTVRMHQSSCCSEYEVPYHPFFCANRIFFLTKKKKY